MPKPTKDSCDAIKRGMEDNKEQYEKAMADAGRSDREASRYVAINNDMVRQVQREIALLGVNTLIRNRGVKLLAGISFLEELDVLNTPQEKSSQIRALMNRTMAAHRDALTAEAEVAKLLREAEMAMNSYKQKKKVLEDECKQ